MVVVDLTVLLIDADLPSPHAVGLHGKLSLDPVADVEIVDVLLADVVAAEPVVVVPVAHLVLHLALGLGAGDARIPHAAAVPVDAHRDDLADRAVVNPPQGFQVRSLMVALQADTNLQLLFLGDLVGLQHLPDTGGIDGHRLFHEDVLAGLHGVFEMDRTEAGRRGEDDQIDAAVDHLLVGVKPGEDLLGHDLHAVALFLQSPLDAVHDIAGVVFERIADGGQLDVAVGGKCLHGGSRSAPAAADESHLDRVVAAGVDRTVQTELSQRAGAERRHGGRFQEFTSTGL